MQSLALSFSGNAASTTLRRQSTPRVGTLHTSRLNGSLLRDVLVDGRWLTVSVVEADTATAHHCCRLQFAVPIGSLQTL
jgi:hypothetical protein